MTFRWILFLLIVTMCGGFLLTSCAPPSDDTIMDAEDAIKKAATAGADEASPTLLNQARELLQEAKMLREQGNNREARNKAALAIIRAQKAERLAGGSTTQSRSAVSYTHLRAHET